ncbi:hypothetical protein EC973_003416 [Apophysomyces ossiformis]|uniref:UspA domain-containing protein n=1 Tax=Apophysomyces ossiformis TaxID=679940 RepID=A0A8H7BXX8_9FUNG|nr:hypothetical protein EC973_003416 [Apophysomyces ossiformis]
MSNTDSPTERRDSLVHHYQHQEVEQQERLQRVVIISLDENSGRSVFDWAMHHFIQPETDMVILVHVRTIDIPVAPYISATGYLDELAELRRQDSHRLLREFAHELVHKKIACKAISMIGDAGTEIVRKATETKADALVMGSRNLGVVKRTLLGSVSDYCVHHCPCTVIVVRPKPHADDTSSQPTARSASE